MKIHKIGRALLALIIAAVILLLLDLGNRTNSSKDNMTRIAIFKIASRSILDETESGIIEALTKRGFIDGQNCMISKYCAEGDMPIANIIALNIVSSHFDMVLTISTLALQVMANAIRMAPSNMFFVPLLIPIFRG